MKLFVLAASAAFVLAGAAAATPVTGLPAPAFEAVDSNGVSHKLSDFAGKTVVLEWTNHDCPFVKKFYDAGAMQDYQKQAAADGVVWLSIISSADGKQGHVTPEKANELTTARGASPAAVLLDPAGTVGKAYGAKTTPHMFVINGAGVLVYAGAIDSIKSAKGEDIGQAVNYVQAALAAVKAGTPVEVAESEPYGCSVKY